MKFGPISLDQAQGTVLAHSQTVEGKKFKKGHLLSSQDIAHFANSGIQNLITARLEAGDISENKAADRLAASIRGALIRCSAGFTGRVNLFAEQAGLLQFDPERLDAFNLVDEAITLATLPNFASVTARQMLATLKIIPFAIPETVIHHIERQTNNATRALLHLAPYKAKNIALIQTSMPGLKPEILTKSSRATQARLANLGSQLMVEQHCRHDSTALTATLCDLVSDSTLPDIILIIGASAIIDRQDVIPKAVERSGGRIIHFGMPVDPGNLLLFSVLSVDGRDTPIPVLGLPGCARAPKLNGFDWVLQRLCADLPITGADIMRMGQGGLLTEISSRPLPRIKAMVKTSALIKPRIAALVLAAGCSRRMGSTNKLTALVKGLPMVSHTVDAVLLSEASPILVVTGHQAEAVRHVLGNRPITLVQNPDYAEGLASSLRAGIAALPVGIDAVIICLGDMPFVKTADINKLIAAFNPIEGHEICVPIHKTPDNRTERGNPVVLGAKLFPALCGLRGDIGARMLISLNETLVCEVPIKDEKHSNPAILTDIDTPEMLTMLDQEF